MEFGQLGFAFLGILQFVHAFVLLSLLRHFFFLHAFILYASLNLVEFLGILQVCGLLHSFTIFSVEHFIPISFLLCNLHSSEANVDSQKSSYMYACVTFVYGCINISANVWTNGQTGILGYSQYDVTA